MPNYHFVTTWEVESTLEEVSGVLSNGADLPRWWPSVYLDVDILKEGDERGVGTEVELFTKGWLPYTLRWQFTVTKSNHPYGFEIDAKGDFVGKGIWIFDEVENMVRITYDWEIEAEKFFLKYFSFIMRPIFKANHHWAMRKGMISLKIELLRRRAQTEEELAQIQDPPKPTWPHNKYHEKKDRS